jgi:hypothetical protein
MRYPITPAPPDAGNKAIAILRIFLWLMPAIFIPIAFFIAIFIYNIFHFRYETSLLIGTCSLTIMATACVGYFDQRLKLMQEKASPPYNKKELARWTFVFVLAQILIAPCICYTVVQGYCLFS